MTAILYSNLNGRKKEMALLRIVGASPKTIFSLMITEAIIISIVSIFASIFILQVLSMLLFPFLDQKFGIFLEYKFLTFNDLLDLNQVKIVINSLQIRSRKEQLRFKSSLNYVILDEKFSYVSSIIVSILFFNNSILILFTLSKAEESFLFIMGIKAIS